MDEKNRSNDRHDEDNLLENEEMLGWLEKLLAYAKGEIAWDTGGAWVCESHPCRPFTKDDYDFGCECGGPGMKPYTKPDEMMP